MNRFRYQAGSGSKGYPFLSRQLIASIKYSGKSSSHLIVLSRCVVQQILGRHDGHIDLAANSCGENDIPIVAHETRVRVDMIITAGVVGTLGMFGQHDDIAGIAVHEMYGRSAAAEKSVVRVAYDQPSVTAAARVPAVAGEGDFLDLPVGQAHAPGIVSAHAPDVLAVGVPPFMRDACGLGHDRSGFIAAPNYPHSVDDREFQAGDRVIVILLGKEHLVRVGRAELGVVVFTIKAMPQLEIAAVYGQRTEHELQTDLRVDEELTPVR